jgi:pimeloyl-ACP methyl ester carboxylesterase
MNEADRASVEAYLAYQRRARPDLARFWGPAIERDFRASIVVDSTGSVRWRHPFSALGAIINDASGQAPDYRAVRAPALALYAMLSQAIAPPDASAELLAQLARFERENNIPWRMESITQFGTGVRDARVERINGVHHLFLDRPNVTLRHIAEFLGPSRPH